MGKRLVVWVEGDRDRDKRFFETIVKARLAAAFDFVLIREYGQRKRVDINRLLDAMYIKDLIAPSLRT